MKNEPPIAAQPEASVCPNCGTPGRLAPIASHPSPRPGSLDVEYRCAACGLAVVRTQPDDGSAGLRPGPAL